MTTSSYEITFPVLARGLSKVWPVFQHTKATISPRAIEYKKALAASGSTAPEGGHRLVWSTLAQPQ